MKHILLVTTTLGLMMGSPAFAQSTGDMSCADFTAMDTDGQMAAMEEAQGAMSSGDAMMSSDAMSSDNAMSSDDAMGSDGAMASGDAMASGEMLDDVVAACEDAPDSMMSDAMQGAMAH